MYRNQERSLPITSKSQCGSVGIVAIAGVIHWPERKKLMIRTYLNRMSFYQQPLYQCEGMSPFDSLKTKLIG
jgi:hypothetical protein